MTTAGQARVLLVGNGIIGHRLRTRFLEADCDVKAVTRASEVNGGWTIDLARPAAVDEFARMVERFSPNVVVLAHGPARVLACEQEPSQARQIHEATAHAARKVGVPTVLVSSDAVFRGIRDHEAGEKREPANAYGWAKACAEEILDDHPDAVITRFSMVYGWRYNTDARPSFVEAAFGRLNKGKRVAAPYDQLTRPLSAAAAAHALCEIVTNIDALRNGIIHIAGSERVSRYEICVEVAKVLGRDPTRVEPRSRESDEHWRLRPAISSLRTNFHERLPSLRDWMPPSLAMGLAAMAQEQQQ